jgi:glycosyltransferase involved in cell wall biosynthesis
LDDHKDPLTSIRAIAVARRTGSPVTLLIAGDGPLRPVVDRVATEDIRVLGFQNDVRRVLAAADLFLLSSRREGLSFALLEAMASGAVPVVSDMPENVEVVGDAGLVARFGDEEGFGTAVAQLASDESLRRRLAQRARERVGSVFRLEEMISQTRAIYEAVSTPRGAA